MGGNEIFTKNKISSKCYFDVRNQISSKKSTGDTVNFKVILLVTGLVTDKKHRVLVRL
jgi:hypothetical protein